MTDIMVHYSGKSVHIMHDDPTVLCEGGCEGDPTPSLPSPPLPTGEFYYSRGP